MRGLSEVHFKLLFLSGLFVLFTHNLLYASDKYWNDYRLPLTDRIQTCLDAPGEEISLNLPSEFLDQNDEIKLYIKFQSYLYDGADSVPKPGFSRWRPHVRVNKHFFSGHYPISVSKFPAEQDYTLNIDSELFEPGDNTITLSFIRNSGSDKHKSIGSHNCLKLIYKQVSFPQAPTSTVKLLVKSTPTGADAYIGGVYKGTTPLNIDLEAGSYNVKVSKAGFNPESQQTYLSGNSKRISFDLEKEHYQVVINSSPSDADAYVNGEHRGRTPLYLDLAPDTYKVKISKPGFKSDAQSITVASSRKRISFDLEPAPILLEVTSIPSGAAAYIDGTRKGQTPLKIEIKPGSHNVKLSKQGYRTDSKVVTLENKNEKVSFNLAQQTKTINVDTNIEKVSVYIDDDLKGYTPLTDVKVGLGKHNIRLQKEGYNEIQEKVTITKDTANIFRDLQKAIVQAAVVEVEQQNQNINDVDKDRVNSNSPPLSKLALVIGNSGYQDSPLKNPVNDAEDISNVLHKLGFEVITETNATKRKMLEAVYRFEDKLRRADIGLFFYAGHGMQMEGTNYLLPIGTNVHSAIDVEFEAVNVSRILGKMKEAGNLLNIVILDACRNSPFRGFIRSSEKGLARMDAPVGTIIAYATSPGSVAYDGDGRNGIFTKHLIAALQEESLTVRNIFDKAGIGVMEETNSQQVPWIHSSPMKPLYISGKAPVN